MSLSYCGTLGLLAYGHGRLIDLLSLGVRTPTQRFVSTKNTRLRQVCQAGAAFAITSVTIDDRTRLHASLGAVVFCGDTKGNISCFLERGPAESFLSEDFAVDGERQEVRRGGEKRAAVESISPCLVLKRQHGKDQVCVSHGNALTTAGLCFFSI